MSTLNPDPEARALPRLPTQRELANVSNETLQLFLDRAYNAMPSTLMSLLVKSGVLDELSAGSRPSAHAVQFLEDRGFTPVAADMLIQLGTGIGALVRKGAQLEPTELSRAFLMSEAPFLQHALLRRHDFYLTNLPASLDEAVLKQPASIASLWTAKATAEAQRVHFEQRQQFSRASLNYFAESATLLSLITRSVQLETAQRLCDLGAGPGAFAGMLRRRRPDASSVTAVDVCFKDADYAAQAGAWLHAEQADVKLVGANALFDVLPDKQDIVFVNRVLSGVAKDAAADWLSRIFGMLAPGGRICFTDFFFTGDPAVDLQVSNVYMYWALWNYRSFTELQREETISDTDPRRMWGWLSRWTTAELVAALERSGFRDARIVSTNAPFVVVQAVR